MGAAAGIRPDQHPAAQVPEGRYIIPLGQANVVRAGEAVRRNPALGEARIKKLLEWAEQGKIRPNVSHRLPLEDYAEAMQLLIDRKAIGRVALMMG